FLLEEMDQDSAHMVAASKVLMLKPVIENGATLPKTQVVDGVITMMPITTTEEKAHRRLEVKAKSTLLIGIPNEHQLKFNSIKDAKQLLGGIEKRFDGNAATKKTQRILLKQQFKNFSASSSEMFDQTFDRLQKNKADLDTMSIYDLYNNLNVYEPKVKGMSGSNSNTQNMVFLSSTNSSTNGVVNIALAFNTVNGVSTASTQVNVVDNLEQIHPNDIKEIDLRWQMAMLTMRARRFLKKTGRKLIVNGNESLRFDMSKSDQAEKVPNYALMAYTSSTSDSKVSNDSIYLETIKLLKNLNEQLLKDLKKSELMVLAYKTGLKSVEERLEFFKKNKFIYLEDIKVLKVKIQMKEIDIAELRRKLEVAQNEKDGIQLTVEKLENASKSLNKLIDYLIVDNCKKGSGYESYNAVPPSYTGNFMPPKPDLSYTSLDEFAIKRVVKSKSSKVETKAVCKNTDAPIVEEWVSDDEEDNETQPKIVKKTVMPSIGNPQIDLQDKGVIDSGCSRHMTWNMSYLKVYKEINGGYVAFGGNPKEGKITRKCIEDETSGILKSFIMRIENLMDRKVKVIRCDNETEFKNREMNQFCKMKVNTACYVQNKVLVVKPHNKNTYELFHGRTPTLSFMRPFGSPVIILNTKDHLGKFDGKADEKFFNGYSLNSKAFRVFNSKTRIVEENLHIRFSESTPNVVGSGPDWLFDIDALTKTMSYEPIITDLKSSHDDGFKHSSNDGNKVDEDPSKVSECKDQEKQDNVNGTNNVNTVSLTVNAVGTNEDNKLPFDPNMPTLKDVGTFEFSNKDEDDDEVVDINNLDTTIQIKEKMYVCQPPGFEDPDFPDRVYKVKKALYGLHQPLRAWYETLSTYLLDNGFQRGKINKTLFIKRHKGDILLVQAYVDDIIFGSTRKEL
nr:retrovirus-related Pol polyprotein from transposon TNT 1-94 [Tanacetum cinerariifolium]